MANKIAMIAIALIMTLSAMSVAAIAAPVNTAQVKDFGNYSFSYNASTSNIYNLSYKTDSGSTTIASSIVTSGANSTTGMGSSEDSNSLSLNNLTVTTASDGNVVLFSSEAYSLLASLSAPSMKFDFTGNVTNVNFTTYQSDYLGSNSSGMMSTFVKHQVYRIQANGTQYFVFSNYASTRSNNTVTYTGANTLGIAPLVVGISSSGALKDKIHQEIGDHVVNKFFYNNSSGQVTGRFLSLQFNTTTGVISNFTDSISGTQIFTSVASSGNGSIGGGFPGPIFPSSQPIVVGSVFFYANNTAVYQIHDNPSLVSNYYLNNGTTTFNVAQGLNISVIHPVRGDISANGSASVGTSLANYTNVDLGGEYEVEASPTIVMVHNSTFSGSLFVRGANVSVTGNSIQVHSNKTAQMTFVAPPGVQGKNITLRGALQYGIDHGKLAAVVVLGQPGQTQSNVTMNYNGSVQVSVQSVNTNSVYLKVSGKSHEGTNIAFFVPNGVINANSTITVKFDSQTVSLTSSANGVINATSSTHATFFSKKVNGGTLIILHVPHFSTHTVEITSSTASGSPSLPLGNHTILYIGLGFVAVVAIAAGVTLTRKRK